MLYNWNLYNIVHQPYLNQNKTTKNLRKMRLGELPGWWAFTDVGAIGLFREMDNADTLMKLSYGILDLHLYNNGNLL